MLISNRKKIPWRRGDVTITIIASCCAAVVYVFGSDRTARAPLRLWADFGPHGVHSIINPDTVGGVDRQLCFI